MKKAILSLKKGIDKTKKATIWPKFLLVAALAFSFMIMPLAVGRADQIDDLNSQIDDMQGQIGSIRDSIDKYEEIIAQKNKEINSLASQIDAINAEIAKLDEEIKLTQSEIDKTELEIERLSLEIAEKEKEISFQKMVLAELIRKIFEQDRANPLELFLGNGGFHDIVDAAQQTVNFEEKSQEVLDKIQELRAQLLAQKNEQEKKRQELADLNQQLGEEKKLAEDHRGAKQQILAVTQESEEEYQNLLAKAKDQIAAVNNVIASIQNQLDQLQDPPPPSGNGDLGWPVPPPFIITAYFHDPTYPFGIHQGIDFAKSIGTPVYAAENGVVAAVDYSSYGYGNHVTVAHGNGMVTLYAHLNSINVSVGQLVSRGQTIGAVGNTGFSTGPHLHFGVYQDGWIDPLPFLQ